MGEPVNTLTMNRQWIFESIQGQDGIWSINFGK